MWTAVSGAVAQSQVVDTVANNLANADTNGFKKESVTFKDYLAAVEREKQVVDVPRLPLKDKDLYPLDGKDQDFVVVDGTHVDMRAGPLKVTHSLYDIALEGPGFLEVGTPRGILWTRAGTLKAGADGTLVTNQGYPVLGPAEDANVTLPLEAQIEARKINVKGGRGKLAITETGEVYVGESRIGKLAITEFDNPKLLRKSADMLFINPRKADTGAPAAKAQAAANTIVHQGVIEGSNVNPIEEMTKLIQANRIFEQNMKAIKTYNELLGREANDVGKL